MQKRPYTHTHTHKKKKKKRNIKPKTCTIEKNKFKTKLETKLAQNIDNNMIYTISLMTSMTNEIILRVHTIINERKNMLSN